MMSTGHKYKPSYFEKLRGRAEVIRLLFKLADEELELQMYTPEQWPTVKPSTPLGQLPILETEDGVIAQTTAIAMFAAQRLGFLPESDWERGVCNSIVVTMNDTNTFLGGNLYMHTIFHMKEISTEEEMVEIRSQCEERIGKAVTYIQSHARSDSKFIFGDKITIADISLYAIMEYCCEGFPETRNFNNWLVKWRENFEADERVKNYLATREESKYKI